MFLDDSITYRQAKPRPLPDILGGEEGIEDMGQVVLGDAGAGILDLDPYFISNNSAPNCYTCTGNSMCYFNLLANRIVT